MDQRPARKSPENDFALRLYYRNRLGDLFIHVSQAEDFETAEQRQWSVDRILADLRKQTGKFDLFRPED